MLFLAHTGITLGTAAVAAGLAANRPKRNSQQPTSSWLSYPFRVTSQGLAALGSLIDSRLLLISALLPDIIDKPLGLLLLRETLNNSRIVGHTLLFMSIIAAWGFYLYRKRNKSWLLVLSFGTMMHLILDRMWLAPKTLLWPLFGFAFEKGSNVDWLSSILHALVTDPGVYIPEMVGAVIIGWFLLVHRSKIGSLIRRGRI